MIDPVSAFIAHMRAMQIGPADPAEIIADDRRRRYRLEGDKQKVRNGSYQLKAEPDGFAVGWCMSFREGVAHAWHSKSERKASAEDRAEWKRKAAEAKTLRDAEALKEAREAAEKAKRIWGRSGPGDAAYLQRKGCGLQGARVWRGLVVVPMYGAGGLVGLQFIAGDGAKRFLKGCAKDGAYFPIVDKDEAKTDLVICEGFATGAALRVALGRPVVVAFDAGNLKPVALAMRRKYPDARIVIAADNDQWTRKPDGSDWNPGVEKAQQAAVAIGGARVFVPQFDSGEPGPTDWDDYARMHGLDVVRECFEEPEAPEYPMPDDWQGGEIVIEDEEPFRVLGHNSGQYFFLPSRNGGQVVALSASALASMAGLMQIHSSYDYWQGKFGDGKISDRKVATLASYALADQCNRVGVFRPEAVRGAGAWRDGGQVVLNDGQHVITKTETVPIYQWKGRTIYEADQGVYTTGAEPLDSADAVKVREICAKLSWANPVHGDLLAGWMVVAPFGSCLWWRPHVHLTGESGAGKSWVLKFIIEPLLGRAGIIKAGQTEAGVRRLIGRSGRPFVLDEAEAENKAQRDNMEKILHLMRAASSGSNVGNAVGDFSAWSCFMLCSINAAAKHQADENRITQLMLAVDKGPEKAERFRAVQEVVEATITPEFAARLQARTMQHLDVLCANEMTFRRAAAALFGRQRNADQLAPMIAGLYMLTSTAVIDYDRALAWLKARDWSWHTSGDDDGDAQNFLRHLMAARVRYDVQGIGRESTIGRMVEICLDVGNPAQGDVISGLKSLGIKVADGKLWIANKSPRISELMRETSWTTWHRTLMDVPGADSNESRAVNFGPGQVSKVRRIPLDGLIEKAVESHPQEEEVPW